MLATDASTGSPASHTPTGYNVVAKLILPLRPTACRGWLGAELDRTDRLGCGEPEPFPTAPHHRCLADGVRGCSCAPTHRAEPAHQRPSRTLAIDELAAQRFVPTLHPARRQRRPRCSARRFTRHAPAEPNSFRLSRRFCARAHSHYQVGASTPGIIPAPASRPVKSV
jgi:hypothetical protein